MNNQKDMSKDKLNKYLYIGILAVSIVFYFLWYFVDGVIVTVDAPSYIGMASDREPGYCSFLWLLRVIFGEKNYFHAVVIIQCLIAAIAATALTCSLRKRFELKLTGTVAVLFMQYGITLLNRFVAQRRYSYYNSIATEGLAYSFWIFFFISIIGILYDKNKKSICFAAIWAITLISIRKQMLVTLPIIFLCIIYIRFIEKKKWYLILVEAVMIVLLCFLGVRFVDCSYNFANRGVFAPHTGDSSFILGTELYLADISMAESITNSDHREIFLEIMKRADVNEYNISYAGEGWHNIEDHYSLSYDRIKFDTVMVVVREYQDLKRISQEQREDSYNEIAGTLMKELLPDSIPKLIMLFGCNVIHGMITTVLKVHPVLNWAALFVYITYIALFVLLLKRKSYKIVNISVLPFAAITLIAIIGNVCLTSITIYCQMRYMLYNTALFYQAGLLMVIELCNVIKADNAGKSVEKV